MILSRQLRSDDGYVLSGWAFLALDDIELNLLAFAQRLEATALDRGVVDKTVLAAVLARDESEALAVVEPLDGSLGTHVPYSLVLMWPGSGDPYQPTTLPRTFAPASGCHALSAQLVTELRRRKIRPQPDPPSTFVLVEPPFSGAFTGQKNSWWGRRSQTLAQIDDQEKPRVSPSLELLGRSKQCLQLFVGAPPEAVWEWVFDLPHFVLVGDELH